jgi:hypothetical protein
MRRSRRTISTPFDYEVIGEHAIDPLRLLVIGDDGQFYTLDLADGHTAPVELTDEWLTDTCDLRDKLCRVELLESIA